MSDRASSAPPEQRRADLAATLDALVGMGAPPRLDETDAWSLGLAAFAAAWRLDHHEAHALADSAIGRLPAPWGSDLAATVLAGAARGLASAGLGVDSEWRSIAPGATPTGDPIADAAELVASAGSGPGESADACDAFARYALVEAALACARVGLADDLVARGGLDAVAPGHPYAAIVQVVIARVAAFRGHIVEAAAVIEAIPVTGLPPVDRLVEATGGLVDGNAARAGRVRRLGGAAPEHPDGAPLGRIQLGATLLVAFGLIAIGEVRRAAGLALTAITGDRLPMVIDRALALELVLAAAILDDDLDAAQSWSVAADAFDGDPIADSTLARMRSRVALLADDPVAATGFAAAAIDLARAQGRSIEVAEAEILVARARIAEGRTSEAGRRLSDVVAEGERDGHHAVRRSAAAELRSAGRRLPPARGSGSEGLSNREREVRDLLLTGDGNAEIAARLHLSPHTVRVHVSRVLAAHGVPTRFALVADVAAGATGTAGPALDAARLAELTDRQRAVVEHLVTGASNAEIAGRLGIAVRTVEKHLGGVMQRWGAGGRAEVVAIAVGAAHGPPGARRE